MEFFHVDECDEIDVDRYNQLEDCLTNLSLYVKLRKERRQQLKQEAQRTKVMDEQLMCAHREGQAKIAENYEKFLQSEENTKRLEVIYEKQKVADSEFVQTKSKINRLALINSKQTKGNKMNTEKLQQIDELLTQIDEDVVALASDVTKLKAKREQIELKLTEISACEQPKVPEFFTKIHAYGIFPNGESCKLAERDLQHIDDAKYMTRATPELAEHDAIALHNYARLLAYRAEHWPEYITSFYSEICHVFYDGFGKYVVRKFPVDSFNSYADSILFPPQAKDQLQQALDNGLLVPYKQTL